MAKVGADMKQLPNFRKFWTYFLRRQGVEEGQKMLLQLNFFGTYDSCLFWPFSTDIQCRGYLNFLIFYQDSNRRILRCLIHSNFVYSEFCVLLILSTSRYFNIVRSRQASY